MITAFVSYAVSAGAFYRSDEWQVYLQEVTSNSYEFDECLKHDGTTTVFLSSFNNQKIVVKRYNTKNKWHFVRRVLQTSRAKNCYQMAERYTDADILTPEPIGFVQERFLFLKLRSWYICRHQDGILLSDFLANDTEAPAQLNTQLATLFKCLATLKLSHGDMKATNLIVDTASKIHLIDLDAARIHRHKKTWLKAITKDWNRLLKNWPHNTGVYLALNQIKDDFFNQQQ